MKKINWKVRVKNPQFWIGLTGVVAAPVLAYFGAAPQDITSWGNVADIILKTVQNPYLVGSIAFSVLGFLGVLTDPTTKGVSDSSQALTYKNPKKNKATT